MIDPRNSSLREWKIASSVCPVLRFERAKRTTAHAQCEEVEPKVLIDSTHCSGGIVAGEGKRRISEPDSSHVAAKANSEILVHLEGRIGGEASEVVRPRFGRRGGLGRRQGDGRESGGAFSDYYSTGCQRHHGCISRGECAACASVRMCVQVCDKYASLAHSHLCLRATTCPPRAAEPSRRRRHRKTGFGEFHVPPSLRGLFLSKRELHCRPEWK